MFNFNVAVSCSMRPGLQASARACDCGRAHFRNWSESARGRPLPILIVLRPPRSESPDDGDRHTQWRAPHCP